MLPLTSDARHCSKDSAALDTKASPQPPPTASINSAPCATCAASSSAAAAVDDSDGSAVEAGTPAAEPPAAADPPALAPPHRHAWAVPHILFVSNVLLGLASGMTIRFFPLYFKNDCGMSPIGVQSICAPTAARTADRAAHS